MPQRKGLFFHDPVKYERPRLCAARKFVQRCGIVKIITIFFVSGIRSMPSGSAPRSASRLKLAIGKQTSPTTYCERLTTLQTIEIKLIKPLRGVADVASYDTSILT